MTENVFISMFLNKRTVVQMIALNQSVARILSLSSDEVEFWISRGAFLVIMAGLEQSLWQGSGRILRLAMPSTVRQSKRLPLP